VYFPGREPDGSWEMLRRIGPKPLIEPKALVTEADWIEAGRRVFDEADHLHLRTWDSGFIAAARSRETFEQAGVEPLPDGTVFGSRWVPTKQGVALSFGNCNNCHVLYMSDGTRVPGASSFAEVSRTRSPKYRNPLINPVQFANRMVTGAAPCTTCAGLAAAGRGCCLAAEPVVMSTIEMAAAPDSLPKEFQLIIDILATAPGRPPSSRPSC